MVLASPSLDKPQRLLDQVRGKIRLKHYSTRTEQAYVDWIRRFIVFHDRRHPDPLGAQHVERFLTHLAVEGRVAASSQNQAKSALLFLYREVLSVELPWLDNVEQARTPKRLPIMLTREEVQAVLSRLDVTHALIIGLYGVFSSMVPSRLPMEAPASLFPRRLDLPDDALHRRYVVIETAMCGAVGFAALRGKDFHVR